MGVVTPISVSGAHSQLAAEADKLGTCIAMFGGSIEDLLAKYQKRIVGGCKAIVVRFVIVKNIRLQNSRYGGDGGDVYE